MIYFKKIKASALQFAILVSVIVAILLSSFLILTNTHRFFQKQSDYLLETIDESQVGLEHAMSSQSNFLDSISLPSKNGATFLKKDFWGGYIKVKSSSKIKQKVFTKQALIGSVVPLPKTAIYISESNLPLIIAGNTNITGEVYVSEAGIKAGVISGNYFNGNALVDGTIKQSREALPELDSQWRKSVNSLLYGFSQSNQGLVGLTNKIQNSFYDETIVVFDNMPVVLSGMAIGNIIIKSNSEIVVSSYATLEDVLLVAPKITIKSGFKGRIHALADSKILIEKNVFLEYPSSLVVLDKSLEFEQPIAKGEEPIYMDSNVHVEGLVIYLKKNNLENKSNTSIAIKENATVMGTIYCEGNTDIRGSIIGSIYTERFIVNDFGSKFINYIFNGKINGINLNEDFVGLPFMQEKKGIAKWLY